MYFVEALTLHAIKLALPKEFPDDSCFIKHLYAAIGNCGTISQFSSKIMYSEQKVPALVNNGVFYYYIASTEDIDTAILQFRSNQDETLIEKWLPKFLNFYCYTGWKHIEEFHRRITSNMT